MATVWSLSRILCDQGLLLNTALPEDRLIATNSKSLEFDRGLGLATK